MTKVFEQWVPTPVPGNAYVEIEDGTVKYGFAPLGMKMKILERSIIATYEDKMDIWLKGDVKLGVCLGLREITGNSTLAKLQLWIGKHRKELAKKRVHW